MTLDEAMSENASLMGAAQGLGELCDKYKTENAELQEMLSESRQTNGRLYAELKRYKSIFRTRPTVMNILFDENDKLRNLVVKAHTCKTDEGCCEDCYQDEGCCPIEREMQELGIEVDA